MFTLMSLDRITLNLLKLQIQIMSKLDQHLIGSTESKILVDEYDKSNYVAINARIPAEKPDSKTITYDLEILQDYINLIREGMEKMGIKNKGIKVNFGKYPEKEFDPRLNPLYKGYQTIFFSPEDLDSTHKKQNIGKERGPEDLPNLDFGQLCPPARNN